MSNRTDRLHEIADRLRRIDDGVLTHARLAQYQDDADYLDDSADDVAKVLDGLARLKGELQAAIDTFKKTPAVIR